MFLLSHYGARRRVIADILWHVWSVFLYSSVPCISNRQCACVDILHEKCANAAAAELCEDRKSAFGKLSFLGACLLSYLILSYLILSYLILSYLISPLPIFFGPVEVVDRVQLTFLFSSGSFVTRNPNKV